MLIHAVHWKTCLHTSLIMCPFVSTSDLTSFYSATIPSPHLVQERNIILSKEPSAEERAAAAAAKAARLAAIAAEEGGGGALYAVGELSLDTGGADSPKKSARGERLPVVTAKCGVKSPASSVHWRKPSSLRSHLSHGLLCAVCLHLYYLLVASVAPFADSFRVLDAVLPVDGSGSPNKDTEGTSAKEDAPAADPDSPHRPAPLLSELGPTLSTIQEGPDSASNSPTTSARVTNRPGMLEPVLEESEEPATSGITIPPGLTIPTQRSGSRRLAGFNDSSSTLDVDTARTNESADGTAEQAVNLTGNATPNKDGTLSGMCICLRAAWFAVRVCVFVCSRISPSQSIALPFN